MLTACEHYGRTEFGFYTLRMESRAGGSSGLHRLPVTAHMLYGLTASFSPSGNWIAFTEWGENTKGDLIRVDARSGKTLRLTASVPSQVTARPLDSGDFREWTTIGRFGSASLAPIWSLDESQIFVFGPEPRDDNTYPVRFDLWRVSRSGSGAKRLFLGEDQSAVEVSLCAARRRPCLTNKDEIVIKTRSTRDGAERYSAVHAATGRTRTVFDGGRADVGGTVRELDDQAQLARSLATPDGHLAMLMESFSSPPQIVVIANTDRREAINHIKLNDDVPQVGTIRRLKWTSPSGEVLGALLQTPPRHADGPIPVLAWVYFSFAGHDREGISKFNGGNVGWTPLLETNRYAVLVPEIPLPTGDGHACEQIAGSVMGALDAALAEGRLDRDRLGIMGYSYGGYLVNCLITQTSRFKAAVAGAGIADWTSLCLGLPPPCSRKSVLNLNAYPWEAPEKYIRNSPIYHVDKIETPLLLLFGKADSTAGRQFVEMYSALATLNKPVQLVGYDGRDHSTTLAHPDLWPRVVKWFDVYLDRAHTTALSSDPRWVR